MTNPRMIAGALFALAALAGVGFHAFTLAAILRRPRAAPAPLKDPPPVSVLVPLCGAEPGLRERLLALMGQEYPAPVQIICGVASSSDGAAAVVETLAQEYRGAAPELVVDPRQHGANRKISNLVNMAARARFETLVMLDSDILAPPAYLARLAAEVARPGVGAVTCLYSGEFSGGLWARLAAMSLDVDFLTSVVAALALRMGAPCFGATIAMTRTTLRRIGGLEAFADRLFDDYAIGAAVRAQGLEVAISSCMVAHVCFERGPRQLLAAQLRRARTIRAIDPAGAAGAIITYPVALAAIAAALGAPYGVALIILAVAVRLAECLALERRFALRRHPYLMLPVWDLAAFAVHVAALFGRGVVWRGRRYRVDARGALVAASAADRSEA